MGSGIAAVAALAGNDVVLTDSDSATAARGVAAAAAVLAQKPIRSGNRFADEIATDDY